MILRSRRKRERDLAGVKSLISKQIGVVKKLGVSALERADSTTYTVGLEKAIIPVVIPIEIKASTTLNFAELTNSEYNEWLELEVIRRVKDVGGLTSPRKKKSHMYTIGFEGKICWTV